MEYVAVVPDTLFGGIDDAELKRYALLFDRLDVLPRTTVYPPGSLVAVEMTHPWSGLEDIWWLVERGVLGYVVDDMLKDQLGLQELYQSGHGVPDRFTDLGRGGLEVDFVPYARLAAARLGRTMNDSQIVIIADGASIVSSSRTLKEAIQPAHICELVIKAFPLPNPMTDWERIIDFRSDPDSQMRLLKLRRWMRKAASASSSVRELAEELSDLQNDYESYMRLQRLKVNTTSLETVVTIAGEALENLMKLKFGQVAKLPFVLRHRKCDLLEVEMKAPGREISYILQARKEFA